MCMACVRDALYDMHAYEMHVHVCGMDACGTHRCPTWRSSAQTDLSPSPAPANVCMICMCMVCMCMVCMCCSWMILVASWMYLTWSRSVSQEGNMCVLDLVVVEAHRLDELVERRVVRREDVGHLHLAQCTALSGTQCSMQIRGMASCEPLVLQAGHGVSLWY